jgi:G:T-mismatch repair DNA endonuclease (very short patch repair protein)
MRIDFIHQYPVRDRRSRFVCVFDFFIPINKVVIEVNGTFWHSDPRVYKKPIHKIQQRNAVVWQRKISVIKGFGYNLVELWEEDIKQIGDEYIRESLLPVI